MTDLDELERLAKAATPGPWRSDPKTKQILRGSVDGPTMPGLATSAADAAFIAAANPDAVLELIERLRAAEAAAVEWERRAEYAAENYRRRNKEAQLAEAIVRDLAKAPCSAAVGHENTGCVLCDEIGSDVKKLDDNYHASECPYRRAVEAQR